MILQMVEVHKVDMLITPFMHNRLVRLVICMKQTSWNLSIPVCLELLAAYRKVHNEWLTENLLHLPAASHNYCSACAHLFNKYRAFQNCARCAKWQYAPSWIYFDCPGGLPAAAIQAEDVLIVSASG